MTRADFESLDRLLSKLDDCDLGQWDRDFVDDMVKRVGKYGVDTIVTAKQWEQLQRMQDQHL